MRKLLTTPVVAGVSLLILATTQGYAQPPTFLIENDVFDSAGGSMSSATKRVVFTVAEPAVGLSAATGFLLWSGFVNPFSETTGIGEQDAPIAVTRMLPPMPNPFNPTVRLGFELASGGEARLTIYDVQGRAVRTLKEGTLGAGLYETTWDGRDDHGISQSSGVYFAHLKAGSKKMTQRLVLLK
jgi:hypothetical protein